MVFVLEKLQDFVIIQQIINFATIYFIHRNSDSEISLCILPIMNSPVEQVSHSQLLKSLHSESLSRSCLPVSEYRNSSCVENEVEDRFDTAVVKFIVSFIMTKSIIEVKFLIFDKLRYAVYLKSVFMHYDLWVGK